MNKDILNKDIFINKNCEIKRWKCKWCYEDIGENYGEDGRENDGDDEGSGEGGDNKPMKPLS